MDFGDEAQARTEKFNQMVMQNRAFDLAPAPPIKTNASGQPLCINCDADISARRRILANSQRCVECQSDHDRIAINRRGR